MFGFPSHRHVMKIAPFTMRLVSATKQLIKAIKDKDKMEIARGIEDVGFWTARTTAELISGQEEGEENLPTYKEAMHALFEAQRVNVRARKELGEELKEGRLGNPIQAVPAKPHEINGVHLDRFTFAHIGGGMLVAKCGIDPFPAMVIGIGFELIEDWIKKSRWNVFPNRSLDTKENALTDALAFACGYFYYRDKK